MTKTPSLRPRSGWFGMFCAFAICMPAGAFAQCEMQKLTGSLAAGDVALGRSIATSRNVLLIGDPFNRCEGDNLCGAAYFYRFDGSTWALEQKLMAPDAMHRAGFAVSVAVADDLAIVGAPQEPCASGEDCGAAYIYRFNGSSWIEEQVLRPHDEAANSWFGFAVSIDAGVVVIGAHRSGCFDARCGVAYVYRFNGQVWIEEQKLTASDAEEADYFGYSVSISGDSTLVGAPLDDCPAGGFCGAAYVFRFNGSAWIEDQKLTPSDRGNDEFGTAVSISGSTSIIGARRADCTRGNDCGAAYAYRLRGPLWIEEQKLVASDARAGDWLGYSLSVDNDVAVVGALGVDCKTGPTCGAAYVYRFNGSSWGKAQRLTASDTARHHEFGVAVAMSEGRAAVGASGELCGADRQCGAAYVFALSPDCNENGQADFCDIRDGQADDGDADGVPDECEVVASLDFEPGKCPNRGRPRERGNIEAALAGNDAFDVTEVDAESLQLRRTDGVGDAVQPIQHRLEGRSRIRDVATFNADGSCKCGDDGRDGFDDLILKFDARELIEAFELDTESPGTSLEISISGAMLDGTIFEATDCILIAGRDNNSATLSGR